MNVKLLRKIQEHILEEPKRLDMGDFISREKDYPGLYNYPKCGTVACIAGWACILSKARVGTDADKIQEKAIELLELEEGQHDRLFYDYNWPRQFRDYSVEDQTEEAAKITVKRIDHFIATKGAE